jgi:TRAP transporter TAXI family solute receptor
LVGNAISNPPGSRECDRGGNCGVPGLIAVAQTTGGGLDNLNAVARGQIELGLTQVDVMNWGFRGESEFAGQKPLTRTRVIARLYPATLNLIARRGAKIASIADLAGKKVSIDAAGSATRFTAKLVLSAHKVRWTTVQLRELDLSAAAAAMAKSDIDAMFVVGGAPVLALAELSRATEVDVVPIDGPTAAKLVQVVPYYSRDVIPAGAYGNAADVPTLAVGSLLIARDDLDDELGYGIAKAIWHERNVELFATGHPRGRTMDKMLATGGLTVPVHPGAARYYIEEKLMSQAPAIAPAEPSTPLPARPARAREPRPSLPPAGVAPPAPTVAPATTVAPAPTADGPNS